MAATDQPDTDELLDLAHQGDDSATQKLMIRHRSRLSQMLAIRMDARLAARFDPSDVVQETLIDAIRQLPEYLETRPLPFYPWLRQLALNRLEKLHAKHIQFEKRSITRENPLPIHLSDESVFLLAKKLISASASPSDLLLQKELRQRVRVALGQLAEDDREILVLRFLEQFTTKEIAGTLGVNESTVRVRQLRAIKRLQGLLGTPEG